MPNKSDTEALDWLARLDAGALDTDGQAQFDQWLNLDTRHYIAFLRAQMAWQRADGLKKLRPLGTQIDEDALKPLIPSRSRMRSAMAMFAIAATVAVVLVTGFLLREPDWALFNTDVGGAERIVLKDGSIVNLNTDSQLRVRLTSTIRDIELVRGEALFQVARDSQRPFIVTAGRTRVQAIGTTFSVRLDGPKTAEILVSEGKVAIKHLSQINQVSEPMLGAGQIAVVRAQGVQVRELQPQDVSRRLAWKEGLLWFSGEPLTRVVAEFNRYNHKQLEIADPSIGDIPIGGGFTALDPAAFAMALEESFGVRATHGVRGARKIEVIQLVGEKYLTP